LRWDNADGILNLYKMPAPFGSFSDQPPAPVIESFSPPEGFERNQLFVAQTRHFIEVVRGKSEPVCGLEAGVMALRLALAAYKSQKSGQRVSMH
jgi:predicted dehydrogenase